jgi:hypothetical protein
MNKDAIVVIIVVIGLAALFGLMTGNLTGKTTVADKGKVVLLETSEGDIKIQLYSDMPITTGNFLKLVDSGFMMVFYSIEL